MQSNQNARRAEKRKNDPSYVRESREKAFERDYGGTGEGSAYHMTAAQVLELEKQYGLYCGTCGHGNGCEHGVPLSRV